MPSTDKVKLDLHQFIEQESSKSMLKFITCGSVDDGKSTLIGRLLYDSQLLYDDQLEELKKDSKGRASTEDDIDFSLLVDGLSAEREQGITIDVAYRFFSTSKRKFIVADTPGHEQYTRNMVTGASTADAAVLLIDARLGVSIQTRRHAYILSLVGVKHIVLAINKIDLKGYSERVFKDISSEFMAFADMLGFSSIYAIPVSALKGDNVTKNSEFMPWYTGLALLPCLEILEPETQPGSDQFRFPVQWVNRPDLNFRGYSGTLAGGKIRVGDEVIVAASLKRSRIKRIVTMDGDLPVACLGDAVTLTLEDEIDVSHGDLLHFPGEAPERSDQFQAHLIWMHEDPMLPERSYLLRIGTQTTSVQITDLKYKINVNTTEHLPASMMELNEIAVCNFATAHAIAFDPYSENPRTGAFILIDRISNNTVAAGMIDFGLRRGQNLSWQSFEINRESRAKMKSQRPAIIWFTGLSASGKSTIADIVEQKLAAQNRHTYLLDGDNFRHSLNKDLGFTDADRVENIRRVAEVARMMADSGLIVITAFISPFRQERRMAKEIAGDIEFIEVFVDASLEVCEARDPKGLYAKARRGEIPNFTGISSEYEPPERADIHLNAGHHTAEELADQVLMKLRVDG
ncbi:MAG: sulfate adenylyltransferase subunit CysN [Proteobacteria bacterium]|nr:sulfate adenylyltransferase subunit CysN [Pseudomonadota bacterium]